MGAPDKRPGGNYVEPQSFAIDSYAVYVDWEEVASGLTYAEAVSILRERTGETVDITGNPR